ncbi:MAG TPA: hypothetical protein VJO53_06430 [Candidatus Acidoferrales bacterium]|nr:hypothetical protein [Candidatus Acidoferrales bacterium]
MMNSNWTKAAACLFSVLGWTTFASAQMGMRQTPMPQGVFNPTVGAGARYDLNSPDGAKTTLEYTVVGKEIVNGKEGYWLEWTTTGARTGEIVMKVLVVPGAANGAVSRTIMQMAGRPPMELPAQMSRMSSQQAPKTDIRGDSDDLGKESVTTPAGAFSCEHLRAKDGSGETWVSDKVSPFGVVKHQGNDSLMVLTQVITGAKDKIVGTPVPMNPSLMMQQMQQQMPHN